MPACGILRNHDEKNTTYIIARFDSVLQGIWVQNYSAGGGKVLLEMPRLGCRTCPATADDLLYMRASFFRRCDGPINRSIACYSKLCFMFSYRGFVLLLFFVFYKELCFAFGFRSLTEGLNSIRSCRFYHSSRGRLRRMRD